MAITAFTKKSSPTNSNDFLKQYEELLKRRKSGGVVTGYDTSGNMAMNMGGAIADPSGLGSNDTSLNNNSYGTIDYATVDPSEVSIGDLSLDDLARFYTNPNLTEEQKIAVENVYNSIISPETANIMQSAEDTNNQVDSIINGIDQQNQDNLNSNTPSLPATLRASTTKSGLISSVSGKPYTGNAAITDAQIASLPSDLQVVAKAIRDNERYAQDSPFENAQAKQIADKQALEKSNAIKGVKSRLDTLKAGQEGISVDQLNQNNNIQLSAPPGYKETSDGTFVKEDNSSDSNGISSAIDTLGSFIKSGRQAVGNTIDALAYAIPGTENRKDTGISEWIAGGPTPHTVSAAEPLNKEVKKNVSADGGSYDSNGKFTPYTDIAQPGQGLTQIQKEFRQGAQSVSGSRPALENVSGLQPVIGNVAGLQDQSVAGSKITASPSGTPIIPASIARVNVGTNLGIGSNTPTNYSNSNNNSNSNNSNNNSNNSNSSSSNSAFKPATTTKTTTSTNKSYTNNNSSGVNAANITSKTTPVSSNIGVGSNTPSTSSSSNNSNLISTIVSIISNLFKRK